MRRIANVEVSVRHVCLAVIACPALTPTAANGGEVRDKIAVFAHTDSRRPNYRGISIVYVFAVLFCRARHSLPPRPNAIDAPVCIAAGIVPNRSARHRTRPEHDAGPGDATLRIINVLAVHDCPSWCCTESDGCKPQQNAGRNPYNCH